MARDDDFNLDDLDTLTFESFDDDESPDPNQYGVWVKSGPEDIKDEATEGSPASEGDSLADEDFLNTDELANLDESLAPGSAIDLEGETFDDLSLDETNQSDSTQLSFEDDTDMAMDIDLSEFISTDEDDTDISRDEIPPSSLLTEDQSEDEFIDIDIEVSDSITDDELEIIGSAQVQHQVPSSSGTSDAMKATETSGEGDFSNEFDQILAEEKSGDFTFDEDRENFDTSASQNDSRSQVSTEPTAKSQETSLAEMILKKIETELASIKSEISDLKSKLANIKSHDAQSLSQDEVLEQEGGGGFFSEDEDEVIALTGDELDSILSSADLTSETAVESTGEIPGDEKDDLLSLDEQGNITESDASSDIDLLQGTDLESSLDEEMEIPNYPLDSPIPGGSNVAFESESQAGVPDSIILEDDQFDSISESESEPELTNEDFSDIDEGLEQGSENIAEEEIDFSNPASTPSTVELVDETEDVTANFFSDDGTAGDDEESISLEIPFDDELLLEDETPAKAAPESAVFTAPVTEDVESSFSDEIPIEEQEPEVVVPPTSPAQTGAESSRGGLSEKMKEEIKSVLSYMDKLLASLPDEKIQEFAESEHFEVYKKLFEELGLTE